MVTQPHLKNGANLLFLCMLPFAWVQQLLFPLFRLCQLAWPPILTTQHPLSHPSTSQCAAFALLMLVPFCPLNGSRFADQQPEHPPKKTIKAC
ncbi:hypothetical protein BC940DRAFT_309101 [Gongronella butleri]|nr:hypothetical protein BC940DRAFT_309101 [Gongronella butleri]